MNAFYIRKSPPLQGTIRINTAKNTILPLMAATLLTDDEIILEDIPVLEDVNSMREILAYMGKRISHTNHRLVINHGSGGTNNLPESVTSKLRASLLVLGPSLARSRQLHIAMPGGCEIGTRPIDLHIAGFKALGADIEVRGGFIMFNGNRMHSCKIYLPFPSVGATQNLIMASVLADGITTIQNAAAEPEIADLANFLCRMGANVSGGGSRTVVIEGVSKLHGTSYLPISDRIEAGTFMIACAMTGGDMVLHNANAKHLMPLIGKLEQAGADIRAYPKSLRIIAPKNLSGLDITSMPYPGFPTDLQSQAMAMCIYAQGTSSIVETVFENRFRHVELFKRMGADIQVQGRNAIINGVKSMTGIVAEAPDLRAGAAIVLAGLRAEGETVLTGLERIDRGYENIENRLYNLGAEIERKPYPALEEADTRHMVMDMHFAVP